MNNWYEIFDNVVKLIPDIVCGYDADIDDLIYVEFKLTGTNYAMYIEVNNTDTAEIVADRIKNSYRDVLDTLEDDYN